MQTCITEDKLYAHPDMSMLITKTAQLNELHKLHKAAVQASREISDADTKLNRMIIKGLKKHQSYQCSTSPSPTAAIHATMTSAAKAVMTQYAPAPTHLQPASDTNLVVDPTTGYVSPHSRNFRSCLGCGDPTHQYRDCAKNKTEPMHRNFTKNFLACYPERGSMHHAQKKSLHSSRFRSPLHLPLSPLAPASSITRPPVALAMVLILYCLLG